MTFEFVVAFVVFVLFVLSSHTEYAKLRRRYGRVEGSGDAERQRLLEQLGVVILHQPEVMEQRRGEGSGVVIAAEARQVIELGAAA